MATRRRKEGVARQMDGMRRVMKENLERREMEVAEGRSREEEAIGRLRTEGGRLVEEEQEEVLRRLEGLVISRKEEVEEPLVKVKWARGVEGYTEAELRQVLLKYGEVATVVVGGRRAALVEFRQAGAARMAATLERGFQGRPLTLRALFRHPGPGLLFPRCRTEWKPFLPSSSSPLLLLLSPPPV